jgi:uncharacterized protein YkwD
MTPIVAMMAAVLGLSPVVVGVSYAQEAPPKTIALVNTHYPQTLADEARALHQHVNAERAKHGLSALVRDESLDRFAYAKAVEMAARGYFGHTSPDGITFEDRLRAWKWSNIYAAENIAFDRDEPRAHAAFMNSPPHARNVLDGKLAKVGIAVVNVGDGETFYVEDFTAN